MPAALIGLPGLAGGEINQFSPDRVNTSFAGPWCFCEAVPGAPAAGAGHAAPPASGVCRRPLSTPEQINLQLAGAATVVVSFVTYEEVELAAPPAALFGPVGGAMAEVAGVP